MGEERRSTPRVRAYRPVRLHQPSGPQVVETLTKDLALGGFRCISPSLFPVATELNVELVLSRGEEPLMVRGKAVWFRMIPQSEQFDLGIAFIEFPDEKKRRLSSYLEHISRQPAFATI